MGVVLGSMTHTFQQTKDELPRRHIIASAKPQGLWGKTAKLHCKMLLPQYWNTKLIHAPHSSVWTYSKQERAPTTQRLPDLSKLEPKPMCLFLLLPSAACKGRGPVVGHPIKQKFRAHVGPLTT